MTRREAILRAGIKALGGTASASDVRVTEAVAAMLAEALCKVPRVKKPPADLSTLPYGPGQVFEQLEAHCADIIQLRPYETNSFGRLGKAMARIQGLELADLERVTSWVQSGGLATWPVTVTWAHVCKHYANWVGYARAWEAKGSRGVHGALPGAESWR